MGEKRQRRRLGDRVDGRLIRDLDSMHIITPIIYPNRCDNEAYIAETIDMEPIRAYVEKKNSEGEILFPYTPFHIISSAVAKILTLRPKLNRFIANRLTYQKNEVSISFVVKKLFTDDSAEGLAIIRVKEEDTINTLHEKLFKQISFTKGDDVDASTQAMDFFSKFPVRLVRMAVRFFCFLEKYGKCPRGLLETDPFYTSCVLSNVGSINLRSGYHHLTNWGTCSLFCMIGEIGKTVQLGPNDEIEVRETVPLGITIDERLADGYYYSKSIRLLKAILANPEVLELPMNQEIDY
ncbi:MAG: 2-oxo acid dehydrogenase subunit E2 [Lachnospiraceae bacterium]